ncbi:HNH endonuclease [Candidatus Nitrosopelagicus sp.]|nr:HNH endonuclease [Candidatus Nitrosopelagicus sp.]
MFKQILLGLSIPLLILNPIIIDHVFAEHNLAFDEGLCERSEERRLDYIRSNEKYGGNFNPEKNFNLEQCLEDARNFDFWNHWQLPLFGLFLLFLLGSVTAIVLKGNSNIRNTQTIETIQYKDLPRKPFPEWVKQSTMQNQDGKCNMCGIPLNNYIAQYDHADNDKTNNQPSNCQALCANCHSEKTKMNR